MPAVLKAHSNAVLRSQKYSRIHAAIMSRPVTADMELQVLSCRTHAVSCQLVSGKRCRSVERIVVGQVARFWCRDPLCTSSTMPEEMLISAMKPGCEVCVVTKEAADVGSSPAEKEPGITRTSN